jgi:Tfp pilus assembly protein PilN
MDAVASAVPANVHLTRMEDRAQTVRFAGVAQSSTALSEFMSNLKTSGKFRDVDLVESRQDLTRTPRTITFEVSARFGS